MTYSELKYSATRVASLKNADLKAKGQRRPVGIKNCTAQGPQSRSKCTGGLREDVREYMV